ncbi:MAG: hypothetical protein DWQ31_13875 [Planctomycetota bacterium]|nr:MAG: hypothetical protein DWQ31_13875 [Planctomycetota bacterium]REJ95035.1 MAG: hypothetical protein DWQ35_07215 [Planctomycetota bacterium]REK24566.1 MAG: hypothetical protein DWQ42_13535 [Planctomycetota bacterium]REK49191.1 MAG: hypothetical protein DWQ46_00835 [Planctomycetota bacterium]
MDGKRPTDRASQSSGVICFTDIYTVEEAKRRLGWSDSALRAAKRRGLRLLRSGKRRYLTGREILRFLTAETEACEASKSGGKE